MCWNVPCHAVGPHSSANMVTTAQQKYLDWVQRIDCFHEGKAIFSVSSVRFWSGLQHHSLSVLIADPSVTYSLLGPCSVLPFVLLQSLYTVSSADLPILVHKNKRRLLNSLWLTVTTFVNSIPDIIIASRKNTAESAQRHARAGLVFLKAGPVLRSTNRTPYLRLNMIDDCYPWHR